MKKIFDSLESLENKYGHILMYLILIPFFRPRGFDSWTWYKDSFTLLLYPALLMILAWALYDLVRRGFHYKPSIWVVAAYYAAFIAVTLLVQDSITEGLQKMFATPVLILFCMMSLRNNSQRFINTLANILLVVMGLNVTVFCPPVMDLIINKYHICFLGHVQTASQFGLLGVLLAYLLYAIQPACWKRALLLAGVSVATMLWSETAASQLVLVILAAGILVNQYIRKLRPILLWDSRIYLSGYLILSMLLMIYAIIGFFTPLGLDLTANGRTIIWQNALDLVVQKPLLGYGAFGALVIAPWSPGGMNYAHNEFLQSLLDGGLVLCLLFFGMLYSLLAPPRKSQHKGALAFGNTCLAALLLVMLFESVTEYYYYTVILVILTYLPELTATFDPKITKEGQALPMLTPHEIKSRFSRVFYPWLIRRKARSCGKDLYVGGKSFVTGKTVLKDNVNFNGMSIMGNGNVTIGSNFHSGVGCQIITSFHNYDHGDALPYDETFIDKDVVIEDNVWLGNNVIILGGVTIGEGAIIQAGSVVCKSVPPMAIAGGHPALPFRYRDADHYNALKEQGKFH